MRHHLLLVLVAILPLTAGTAIGGSSAAADTIGTVDSTLGTLLGKYDALPDGSLTTDDPLPVGNSIHVVSRDNQDGWKIDVGPIGAVTYENDTTCDPTESPLPPGALH